MDLEKFLEESFYVDYENENIISKAEELFSQQMNAVQKAKAAYEFVRDEIPHSFDKQPAAVTARASDVLRYKTGICHAKSNLLAALLRSQGIPAGFCFEHITLVNDDSMGYCLHCYNAVYLDSRWIRLDARGNKEGINAQFSVDKPVLAYIPRPQYDEYFIKGIFSCPDTGTMKMLENAKTLEDIMENIPDCMSIEPDII
ncbi:MAG: transglutaminase-like domain-containing protein [Oscillospiraceae bacterium]|nr:transglutaminase-like domain-containing protein [Oscillospiraceae bacterium]